MVKTKEAVGWNRWGTHTQEAFSAHPILQTRSPTAPHHMLNPSQLKSIILARDGATVEPMSVPPCDGGSQKLYIHTHITPPPRNPVSFLLQRFFPRLSSLLPAPLPLHAFPFSFSLYFCQSSPSFFKSNGPARLYH